MDPAARDEVVRKLVELIFSLERSPKKISFCIPWLDNTRDLFLFCFELFVGGVAFRHCKGAASIPLHEITRGQFMDVAACMYAAGIDCNLRVVEGPHIHGASLNIPEIMAMDIDLDLSAYVLVARHHGTRYELTFTLFHNTAFPACNRGVSGAPAF